MGHNCWNLIDPVLFALAVLPHRSDGWRLLYIDTLQPGVLVGGAVCRAI